MPVLEAIELRFSQVFALLHKSLLSTFRSWINTLIRIILPGIFVLLAWSLIIKYGSPPTQTIYQEPGPIWTGDFPKCKPGSNGTCITLMYAVDSNANSTFADQIMKNLASINNPKLTMDVDVVKASSPSSLQSYFKANPNITQAAVEFQTVSISDSTKKTDITYRVYYNSSFVPFHSLVGATKRLYQTNFRLQTQTTVDRAIAYTLRGSSETVPQITVAQRKYPPISITTALATSSAGYLVTASLQTTFYIIAGTINFLYVLMYIVNDRSKGIRGYLKLCGLKDAAYWIAVLIESSVFLLLITAITLIFGYSLPNLVYFENCNAGVMICVLLTYGLTMIFFACLLSTLIGNHKLGYVIAGVVFFIGLFFGMLFSILDVNMYYFYASRWVNLFQAFPPFVMAKIFLDIKIYTVGPLYPILPSSFTPTHYKWDDLHKHVPKFSSHQKWQVPTTADSLYLLLGEALIMLVLTWYLDCIVPDKHKAHVPFWFPLTPTYWGYRKKPIVISQPSLTKGEGGQQENQPLLPLGSSDLAHQGHSTEMALVVEDMCKDYSKGCCKSGALSALKSLSITVADSTVFCILGHNGAGKTTAINCLIGLQRPSEGVATIYGLDIARDVQSLHEIMGICPQFDMLFNEMTAMEHLVLVNRLKRKSRRHTKEELMERLFRVRLEKNANQKAGTFSGGMKRRLSFIISTIGDPKVIFLDEPTTGIDPGNRNYVWDMIKEFKHHRLIILTTHSMEEADTLGEKIAIMANGKLRAEGNSLELKNRFGTGYRVSLNLDPASVEAVKEEVRQVMPTAQLLSENAGSLVYGLDMAPDDVMAEFFAYLQTAEDPSLNGEKLIKDWGLKNTTLEDVFIAVTRTIVGQDVVFVGENRKQRRMEDEREHFKAINTKLQKDLRALRFQVDVLRRLLEKHGVQVNSDELEYVDNMDSQGNLLASEGSSSNSY